MHGNKPPRLTVIIPAYNAEAYIERSVRSVLDQSFSELRLIVVDDGSGDRTGDILAALSAEDPRLTLLDAENRGPAMARNLALELLEPETEYVMFMDADDQLLPDAVEYAINGAGGAAMVVFGYSIVGVDGTETEYFEPEQHLDRRSLGGALAGLYKANLLNQVWGKLFSAALIRDNALRFPDYRWGEDRLFIYDCLERAEAVAVLPQCKYHYFMHPGESLINKYYDRKLPVCLEADARMQQLCRRFGAGDQADFRYMFAKSVFSCITMLFSGSCPLNGREKRRYIRETVNDPQVRQRCRRTFGGFAVNFLCAVVQSRSVGLNMAVFSLVAMTGRLDPRLFIKLKHRK